MVTLQVHGCRCTTAEHEVATVQAEQSVHSRTLTLKMPALSLILCEATSILSMQ